jgi:hypothetical protein
MSRMPRRKADLYHDDGHAPIQSVPTVQLISPDAVVEFARLLARAAARRVVCKHTELHTPTEVPST